MVPSYALPQVAELQNRFLGKNIAAGSLPSSLPVTDPTKTTISALAAVNPHTIVKKHYSLQIAIISLDTEELWWFRSCTKCRRGVKTHGESHRCYACGVTTADIRYRVTLTATDLVDSARSNTTKANFVFFGNTAEQLIGCLVTALITPTENNEAEIPQQIRALYNKQYDVIANVTDRTLRLSKLTYQVSSFSPVMVPQLEQPASSGIQPGPTRPCIHNVECNQKGKQVSSDICSPPSNMQEPSRKEGTELHETPASPTTPKQTALSSHDTIQHYTPPQNRDVRPSRGSLQQNTPVVSKRNSADPITTSYQSTRRKLLPDIAYGEEADQD